MIDNWKLAVGASAAVASGVLAGALIASSLSDRKSKVSPIKKWVCVGRVSKLILYPVKSCQGIHVDEATATMIGLNGITINKLYSKLKECTNYLDAY